MSTHRFVVPCAGTVLLTAALLTGCSGTSTPATTGPTATDTAAAGTPITGTPAAETPTGTTPMTGSATDRTSAPAGTTTPGGVLVASDTWAKAVTDLSKTTMTGVFGVLKNTGTSDITVVSATSDTKARVELHETVMTGGVKKMQVKQGGFVLKAGETRTLAPGGDHIMLMGLTAPIPVGTTITVTLITSDGTTISLRAVAKEFTMGNEPYATKTAK